MGKLDMLKAMVLGTDPYVASIRETPDDIVKQIIEELPPGCRKILELGGGSGAVSRKLAEYLPTAEGDEVKLCILERNKQLADLLRQTFPTLKEQIYHRDARYAEKMFAPKSFNAVVSGIPYSMYSKETRKDMVGIARSLLRENGRMIVYQVSDKVATAMQDVFGKVRMRTIEGHEKYDPQFIFISEKKTEQEQE